MNTLAEEAFEKWWNETVASDTTLVKETSRALFLVGWMAHCEVTLERLQQQLKELLERST